MLYLKRTLRSSLRGETSGNVQCVRLSRLAVFCSLSMLWTPRQHADYERSRSERRLPLIPAHLALHYITLHYTLHYRAYIFNVVYIIYITSAKNHSSRRIIGDVLVHGLLWRQFHSQHSNVVAWSHSVYSEFNCKVGPQLGLPKEG